MKEKCYYFRSRKQSLNFHHQRPPVLHLIVNGTCQMEKNTYLIDDGEGNKKFYGLSSWPNYVSLQKALKSFWHMISEFGFVKE